MIVDRCSLVQSFRGSEVSESGDQDAASREVQIVSDALPRGQPLLLAEYIPPLVVHLVGQEAQRRRVRRAVCLLACARCTCAATTCAAGARVRTRHLRLQPAQVAPQAVVLQPDMQKRLVHCVARPDLHRQHVCDHVDRCIRRAQVAYTWKRCLYSRGNLESSICI